MRMILTHHFADNKRRLVSTPVINLVHRPEYPALNRLQAVVHIRNRPVLDYIGGVFEEVAVHHRVEILINRRALVRLTLALA